MPDISWGSQADWDASQSRSRVVTRDVGVRVPDEVWQGFDPSYAPYSTLTSYWPLDETSGSTAYDAVGTDNGPITGATPGSQGILSSKAYDFDGNTDYVETSFNPPNDGIASTSFWVNFDSVTGDQLCGLNDATYSDPRFYLGLWGGDVIGGFGSNSAIYATTLSTGTWYHFAMTGDGSTARVYLDGTEVATFTYHFDQADIGFLIGGRNYPDGPSRYVDGQISDVMVWTRALSASEVQTISDTRASGALVSSAQQNDGTAEQIQTTATVPTNTTATLTVAQDTTGNGTANNTESVSLASGTNTTTLSMFESAAGADYWLDLDLQTTAVTTTAKVDTATLSLTDENFATDAGSITTSSATPLTTSTTAGIIGSDAGSITASTAETMTAGEVERVGGSVVETTTTPVPAETDGRSGSLYWITDYVAEGELVDATLARFDEDGATIWFPPGTYQLGAFHSKADDLHLVAPEGDVTLEIVGEGETAMQFSGDGWLLRGFEFDYRDAPSKQLRAGGSGWTIAECVWRGTMAWDAPQAAQAIAAEVAYPRGEGMIWGCYFHDGASNGYGRGVRVLEESLGTVEVAYCWFDGWCDGAIAGEEGQGPLKIRECFVRNSTGGITLNGPAQVMSSTLVCDGETPIAAASGHATMECRLAGDRRVDRDRVYLEDCDFYWTAAAPGSAGYPIDNTLGIDHLHLYACRIHNETTRPSIAIGSGTLEVHRTEVSGFTDAIRKLGGYISEQEIRVVSGEAADPTPPIPEPPALGETPLSPRVGSVTVGNPGGSYGRFYNA